MADIILHRRSFDTGSVPTTHSLGIAQFAINVPDGKVFIHKSSSVSESIVSVVTTDSITTGSITLTETASAALFIGTFTGSMIGNITNADTASVALRLEVAVQNKTGATIPKGKVVRISGSVGDNPLVTTASYENDPNSANTLGFAFVEIENDGSGSVITNGVLTGVNTSGFTAGDLLYLGPTGSYTTTAPVAPLHGVRLGEVLRVHASQGSIYVNIINGFELGELHDVVDSTTTASYGDLLVKSGSVWINSQLKYGRELHVSVAGSDSTGDGSFIFPFRTIGKALDSASSAVQIVVHPGTYAESPVVSGSASNVTITATNNEIGGIVEISGSLTVEQYTASTKVVGLAINNLIHTGSQNLYLQNVTIRSGVSKTGNGYLEATKIGCQSPANFSVTAPGTVVVQNSLVDGLVVNNASAVVNLLNNVAVTAPSCSAGILSIDGGVVYSQHVDSGSVFSGVGSVVSLANIVCLTPTNNSASIQLSAASGNSIKNVTYNKVNSTLGVSLNNKSHFQHIQADALTGSLKGSAETASYADPGFKIGSASFYSYKQDTLSVGNYSWPFPSGSSKGSTLTYNVISGSNARTGQALISWVNRTCSYTETTTLDIGNTSGVTLSCSINNAGDVVHAFYFPSVSWSLSILATLL